MPKQLKKAEEEEEEVPVGQEGSKVDKKKPRRRALATGGTLHSKFYLERWRAITETEPKVRIDKGFDAAFTRLIFDEGVSIIRDAQFAAARMGKKRINKAVMMAVVRTRLSPADRAKFDAYAEKKYADFKSIPEDESSASEQSADE